MTEQTPEDDATLRHMRAELADALEDIAEWRMPFGKYGPQLCPPHGVPLYDLPLEYLLWFKQKGFPKGRLGQLLAVVCQIKSEGSEAIFDPVRKAAGGRTPLRKPRRRSIDIDIKD